MSGMADRAGDREGSRSAGPADVAQARGYVPGYMREIASAILIGTCGRILLQQRDDVPGIRYPGMVALFGGHREGGESFLQCVTREVHEEIGIPVAAARFEPLVRYQATYADGGGLIGEFFVVRDIPVDDIVVTEGSLLAVQRNALPALLHRMPPSTGYVVQIFLGKE
jgi:8-oxo-dGTP pyrophosphatase MutT (NUDIX family)